jgi:hypothetical protein
MFGKYAVISYGSGDECPAVFFGFHHLLFPFIFLFNLIESKMKTMTHALAVIKIEEFQHISNTCLYNSDAFVSCNFCWYDRGGIFASGAADDAIRLFVDDNSESQVCHFFSFPWLLHLSTSKSSSKALLRSLLCNFCAYILMDKFLLSACCV